MVVSTLAEKVGESCRGKKNKEADLRILSINWLWDIQEEVSETGGDVKLDEEGQSGSGEDNGKVTSIKIADGIMWGDEITLREGVKGEVLVI